MSIKRMATRFAAILLTICILLSVPAVFPGETVSALDFSMVESKLNTWQYYLCRTAMSISLKDYYDKNGIEYDPSQFPDCEHCAHCGD